MTEVGEEIFSFVTELTELTRKYGVFVWGCGCCGSPKLKALLDEQVDAVYTAVYVDAEGCVHLSFR